MSQHPPDPLIQRFVRGDVPDGLAVELAIHVDECALCASRTAALEPLAQAFASAEDPSLPSDLVEQILAELDRPQVQPVLTPGLSVSAHAGLSYQTGVELLAGAILLSMAGSLLLLLGEPHLLAADLALGAHAAATAASIGASSLNAVSAAWPAMLAAIGFAGCLWAASSLQTQPYSQRREG